MGLSVNRMGTKNVTASEAQQIFGTEFVPGTELMREDSHNESSQILVPQPSYDPADPLNWSYWRKVMASLCLALYTFLTTTSALSMAPLFPLFGETFDKPETTIPIITGVTVITLGYSNVIVIPFSNVFGRRAVCLFFGVFFFVCCIWQAVAKSWDSFLAARAFVGIAAAPSETLMVQVVADLFFLHERGLWMGVYFASLCFGCFIGPVISGAIAQTHGWRSFFWLSAGLIAFNVLLMLFFVPETKYNRVDQSSRSITSNLESGNKQLDETNKVPTRAIHVESVPSSTSFGKGSPSMKQYLLIQAADHSWKIFLIQDFISPIRIIVFPIVLFAALNFMGVADMVLFWNLTESSILGAPPYNFTPSGVGYSNFGLAGGSLLGMLTAGPLSDLLMKRATARNNGIREAEMRLPALLPFAVLSVVGTVIGGFSARNGWAWPVLVVIGYGTAGMSMTAVPAIAVAYAVDAYKPLAGEIMIVGTVFKNTLGFSMSYWVPSMSLTDGYMTPLMIWFVFTVIPLLSTVPLYFWGKKLRVMTAKSPVHNYDKIL